MLKPMFEGHPYTEVEQAIAEKLHPLPDFIFVKDNGYIRPEAPGQVEVIRGEMSERDEMTLVGEIIRIGKRVDVPNDSLIAYKALSGTVVSGDLRLLHNDEVIGIVEV